MARRRRAGAVRAAPVAGPPRLGAHRWLAAAHRDHADPGAQPRPRRATAPRSWPSTAAVDRLTARRLLRGQDWAAGWCAAIRVPSSTVPAAWWPPRRPGPAPLRRCRRRAAAYWARAGPCWRRRRAGRDRARAAAAGLRVGGGRRGAGTDRCSACGRGVDRGAGWRSRRVAERRCSAAGGGAGRLLIDTDADLAEPFASGAGARRRSRSAPISRTRRSPPPRRCSRTRAGRRAGRADRPGPPARPPRARAAGAPGRAAAGRDRLEAVDDARRGTRRRAAARGARRRGQRRLDRLAQGLRTVAGLGHAGRRCTRSSQALREHRWVIRSRSSRCASEPARPASGRPPRRRSDACGPSRGRASRLAGGAACGARRLRDAGAARRPTRPGARSSTALHLEPTG